MFETDRFLAKNVLYLAGYESFIAYKLEKQKAD